MEPINFTVPGIPRPGGSKTATLIRSKGGAPVMRNGRPLIVTREAGTHTAEWRSNVKFFASQAYQGPLLSGPLRLVVTFVMPRPKAHYGKHGLKPIAPTFHTSKPDTTKLLRAIEDSLKSVLWVDDSQVAEQFATKVYDEKPGAHVRVELIDRGTQPETRAAAELFEVPA